MDINCGAVLVGTATADELGEHILEKIVVTASGWFKKKNALPWRG